MKKQRHLARLEDLIEEGEKAQLTVKPIRSGNREKFADRGLFTQWKISCIDCLTNFKDRPYLGQFKAEVISRMSPNIERGLGILRSVKGALEKGYLDDYISAEEKKVEPDVDNYVAEERIKEIASLPKDNFDTAKLVKLCEEINQNYEWKNCFAVGALLRTTLDHIPPIFEKESFEQVASEYSWGRSHKSLMVKLSESAKKIAHSLLHKQIRKSKVEVLPKKQRVDFRAELDILLAEIVTILKSKAKGKKSA